MKTRYFYFLLLFITASIIAHITYNSYSYNTYLNENKAILSQSDANFTNFYEDYLKTYPEKINVLIEALILFTLLTILYGLSLIVLSISEWKENTK